MHEEYCLTSCSPMYPLVLSLLLSNREVNNEQLWDYWFLCLCIPYSILQSLSLLHSLHSLVGSLPTSNKKREDCGPVVIIQLHTTVLYVTAKNLVLVHLGFLAIFVVGLWQISWCYCMKWKEVLCETRTKKVRLHFHLPYCSFKPGQTPFVNLFSAVER